MHDLTKEVPAIIQMFSKINQEVIRPALQKKQDEYEKLHPEKIPKPIIEDESSRSGTINNNK